MNFRKLAIANAIAVCAALIAYGLSLRQISAETGAGLEVFAPEKVLIENSVTSNYQLSDGNEVSDAMNSWPCLNGPNSDGSAPGIDLHLPWPADGPPVAWRIPCGAGYSSPVGSDGRVVMFLRQGDEEMLQCLDLETGKEIWSYQYPTQFKCGSTYTNGPYSTPSIDDGRVYSIGAEGKMNCVSLMDGSVHWQRDLQTEFDIPPRTFGVGHSPTVWNDAVIVNVGGKTATSGIVAFDKRSGEQLWQATDFGASYASPRISTIHGHDYLYVLTEQALVGLEPKDGSVLWSIPFKSAVPDGENASTPLVYGDLLLACSYGTGSICLQIDEAGMYKKIWESRRQLTSQYTSLLCKDGYVFGIHTDFSLRCLNLATGEVQWRKKNDLLRSNQCLVGDNLLMIGEHGHLAVVKADAKEFKCLIQTKEPVLNVEGHMFQSPAIFSGKLLIRSEHELVCFDLRGEQN